MSSKASFFNDISLQKLLHYLENFRKLKGKVKKDEEPDWDVNKGLRSVRCVFFTLTVFLLIPSFSVTTFIFLDG